MTVLSTTCASPVYTSEIAGPYAFNFKVASASEVRVTSTLAAVTRTLDPGEYLVTLNPEQWVAPGGAIDLNWIAEPGEAIQITRVLSMTQETDIQNAGGFFPEVLENALDKLTQLVQQVAFGAGLVTPAALPTAELDSYLSGMATYVQRLADLYASQSIDYHPQVPVSAAYPIDYADSGRHIFHIDGDTARTATIPANGTAPWDIGTELLFVNGAGSGVLSIAIAAPGVLRLAGSTSTGTRSLAANGMATAMKIKEDTWIISGTGLT
jgi:hypothetical protein